MRGLGHACVTLYLFCVANVVSTFVPGGPLFGAAVAYLIWTLVFVLNLVHWVLRDATPFELQKRPWVLYRALPRSTLVVGLTASAALLIVFVYDAIASEWSQTTPRSAFAAVGVVAVMSALNPYACQAIIDRGWVTASDNHEASPT